MVAAKSLCTESGPAVILESDKADAVAAAAASTDLAMVSCSLIWLANCAFCCAATDTLNCAKMDAV